MKIRFYYQFKKKMINENQCFTMMTRTYKTNKSLLYLQFRPDNSVVSEISQLLYKKDASSDILLSITSLIHTYCKLNENCNENVKLIADVVHMEQKIKENILIKENRDEVND